MNNVDDKLEKFTRTVMMEVTQKRAEILKKAEQDKSKAYEQKELDFLETAYECIQMEIRNARKEKHEEISRAVMERKRILFQKRSEIIEEVFSDLENEIVAFIKSQDYEAFLLDRVKKGCTTVGIGEILVYLNAPDMKLAKHIKEKIAKELDITIHVEEEVQDIMGGCKVLNKTKNIIVDYSILSNIEQQREEFLKISGLVIE